MISAKAKDYAFDRIPPVEKSILRLGVYELLHSDLSMQVIIAEAVRLARKFATKEGSTFVNAILDALQKEREKTPSAKNPKEQIPL